MATTSSSWRNWSRSTPTQNSSGVESSVPNTLPTKDPVTTAEGTCTQVGGRARRQGCVVFNSIRKGKAGSAAGPAATPFPSDPALGSAPAIEARAAVLTGDFHRLRAAFAAATNWSEREVVLITIAALPDRPPAFDHWVEATGGDPLALLVRGAHTISWAWETRTGARAEQVGNEQFAVFWERLRMAESDLYAVTSAMPTDPLSWGQLLISGRGLQVPKTELALRLNEATRRGPDLYFAHEQYLQGICEKWSGSHRDMFDYARQAAERGGPRSPLCGLVAIAHLEMEIASRADFYFSGEVSSELHEIATRSLEPGFPDGAAGAAARNALAVALLRCRNLHAAQQQMVRLRGRLREFPWSYLGDPAAALAKITI